MQEMKEVELELTIEELKLFASYCNKHEIKFNDWVRQLAHAAIKKENEKSK